MKIFTMVFAAALALCGLASAQRSTDSIKVHFDQAVMAGSVELPAGEYSIRELPTGTGNIILSVRSESGTQATLLVNPVRVNGAAGTRAVGVVLAKRGEQYFLDKIWMAPDVGYAVMQ